MVSKTTSTAGRVASIAWRSRWLTCLGLSLLTATLYLPYLGLNDLVHEETRKAVIARTMMDTGDYLLPRLAEEIYLSKPPLFNWLIAGASLPGGSVTEFTARLPSVVAMALTAVFMVLTAGRHLQPAGRWLLGVGILLTAGLMRVAPMAVIDSTFTLLVSASLWTWFELDNSGRRGLALWLPPALLVAAAYLAKREPALVFYYLGVGAYLLAQGRLRVLLSPAHLVAALVTACLAGGWMALVVARVGPALWLANFQQQVLERGLTRQWQDYVTALFEYPFELMIAALPLSLLLPALFWPRVRAALRERYGNAYRFALLTTLVNLPVYWFRAKPEVRYLLPMAPTAVVLAVMVFEVYAVRPAAIPAGASRVLRVAGGALAFCAAVMLAAMIVLAVPGLAPSVEPPLPSPTVAALLGAAGLTALSLLLLRRRGHGAVVLFTAVVAFGLVMRLGIVTYRTPHEAARIVREHDDVPALLASIRASLPADVHHVQAVGTIPHAVWFYDTAGLVVPEARWRREGRPASAYVLVHQDSISALARLPADLVRLDRFDYQDGDFFTARLDGEPPASPHREESLAGQDGSKSSGNRGEDAGPGS